MMIDLVVEGGGLTTSISWEAEADMLFMLMTAWSTKEPVTIKTTDTWGPITTETTVSGVVLSVQPQKPSTVRFTLRSSEPT